MQFEGSDIRREKRPQQVFCLAGDEFGVLGAEEKERRPAVSLAQRDIPTSLSFLELSEIYTIYTKKMGYNESNSKH